MLLCAVLCSITVLISVRFSLALIFIAFAIIIIFTLLISKNAKPQYIVVLIIVLLTIFSTVLNLSEIQKLNKLDKKRCDCEFIVNEVTFESLNYFRADITVTKSKLLKNGTKLSLNYYDGKFKIGDKVKAEILLSKIEGKYKTLYYSEEVFLTAELENYKILKGEEDLLLKGIGDLREYIRETVFGYMPFREAATLCALLMGDKDYFTAEFYDNVIKSGTAHVMVVSGMHLTIFVTMLTALLNKVFYNRYICAVLQIFAVLLLTFLCGFTMSMLRAGVMYSVVSVGLIIGRKSVPENSLGAAVSFILAVSPFAVFNVAFRLSVLSTFGILSVALPISKYLKEICIFRKCIIKWVFESILVSVCATLLTLPVVIDVFGFVSTVGVITTLIITIPVTLSIWLGFIGLLINLLFSAEIVFIPCKYLLRFANYVINEMGSLPFAVVNTDKVWIYISNLIIILIFSVLLACKKRNDMLKLKRMREKIISEGGGKLKWR